MTRSIFSLQTLGACWAGLAVSLGSGAVALQLTEPAPIPPVTQAAAVEAAPPVEAPAVALPPVAPMPFQNSSLLALLPPLVHAAPLPVPPVPPTRHVARAEPRRHIVTVYAAQPTPAYEPSSWGRAFRYPISRFEPYAYAAPPSYYGW